MLVPNPIPPLLLLLVSILGLPVLPEPWGSNGTAALALMTNWGRREQACNCSQNSNASGSSSSDDGVASIETTGAVQVTSDTKNGRIPPSQMVIIDMSHLPALR